MVVRWSKMVPLFSDLPQSILSCENIIHPQQLKLNPERMTSTRLVQLGLGWDSQISYLAAYSAFFLFNYFFDFFFLVCDFKTAKDKKVFLVISIIIFFFKLSLCKNNASKNKSTLIAWIRFLNNRKLAISILRQLRNKLIMSRPLDARESRKKSQVYWRFQYLIVGSQWVCVCECLCVCVCFFSCVYVCGHVYFCVFVWEYGYVLFCVWCLLVYIQVLLDYF